MNTFSRGFGSDNQAGIHPRILDFIQEINRGHTQGYGNDSVTREAELAFKEAFGPETEVFFTYNGTGANVLALRSLADSVEAVLCSQVAHIYEDEAGAPEKFTGCKLIPIAPTHGKISPEQLLPWIQWQNDVHRVHPKVVSLTNSTEFGTVYSMAEIKAFSDFCKQHGLYLHVDGARISNAMASLGASWSELRSAGVDVLSFGGTKNGLWAGEAVVFLQPELARKTASYRKQQAQLHSKMRFISGQFIPFLRENLWKQNALHANAMAQELAAMVSTLPEVILRHPVQANGVFASIPLEWNEPLMEKFPFYIFEPEGNVARWMCAWDTQKEDILAFFEAMRTLSKGPKI